MATLTRQQGAVTITREARGRVPGDGIELAFGYWPGQGAPVVALHGLTATYVTFMGVAERLAGRRPLFAPDLRGRGDSDKPSGPYGMAQHARDVVRAMRALGMGPSVIVGHSMGAFIATALAASEPALVTGLNSCRRRLRPSHDRSCPASFRCWARETHRPASTNVSLAPGLSRFLAQPATIPAGIMEPVD